MRIKFSVFSSIMLLVMAGCTSYKVLRMAVGHTPQSMELVNNSDGNTYSIEVLIKGKTDGSAIISLSGYGKAEVEGDFDWTYFGDWYSDTAMIEYEPIDATAGELVIKFKFHEL